MSWQDAPQDDGFESGDAGQGQIPPFLLDPMGILARRRLWMLLALILGLAATGVAFSMWPVRYEAVSRVMINSQQIPREFVRSTVAESSMAYLNAAVGRVLSHANLDKIIESHDLYPALRDRMPRESLVDRMRGDITIEPEKSVSREGQAAIIYRLAFESGNAQNAADVANALALLLLDTTLEQRTEQARSVTRFLKQALERDERELRSHSQKLTDFRREHRGVLPNELDPSIRKLEMLHDRRASVATEIARLESNLDNGVGERGELSENEALLRELRRKLAAEVAANTDEHPNVISLRKRVADLEAVVKEERAGGTGTTPAIAAGRTELSLLRRQLVAIDREMDELVQRIDRIPAISEEMASLEQKEQVLRENYLASLRKVEEAELAETLETAQHGAQIEILERARPPAGPKRPRWLVLAAGIVASFGFAVGVALLLELVDPVVLNARQLEDLVDRPVLGSMPRVRPQRV